MIDQNVLYSDCPCGSGKKFKFCCYPVVRSELPRNPSRSDVTTAIRKVSATRRLAERKDEISIVDLDRFHELMRRGLRHLNSGEYKASKEVFLDALKEFDMLPTAYNNLAVCALVQGNLEEAEKWVQEVVRKFPVENPFGLALLADLRYLRGDNIGAREILDRAEEVDPPSVDQAVRVCESLAHFMDHERIIRYVEKSGYDDDPDMALFHGIALANVGRRDDAVRVLRNAKRGRQPEYAERVLREVERGGRASTICGDWMYFTPQSFTLFAGLVESMKSRSAEQLELAADVVAELAEVEANGGVLEPSMAVELLSHSVGRRSERLLNAFRSNVAFPESVRSAAEKTYAKLFAKDGLGQRFQDGAAESLQKMIVTEDAATHAPLERAFQEDYHKAICICMDQRSPKQDLEEAQKLLEDLYAKFPDNPAVANNYASVLSRLGQMDRALGIVRDCFAQHPEYVFGAANYLRQLLAFGRIGEARAVVDNYRLPQRIHPDAYIAWMKSELIFFEQTGDRERAQNTQDAIDLIQKQFGRKQ